MPGIVILSLESDLHAHAVINALRSRTSTQVYFVATDALFESARLTWRHTAPPRGRICSYSGEWFDASAIDVIWWRRVNQSQKETPLLPDEESLAFISNEWRAAIQGVFFSDFQGIWINNPLKEIAAGNKLYQLQCAKDFGFVVPDTLISNDPDEVICFCQQYANQVVAKKLIGATGMALATIEVDAAMLEQQRESIQLCPAIYQERILAAYHLRVNCFGKEAFAFSITTDCMDWRRDPTAKYCRVELDQATHQRLIDMLSWLGLEMGVFDLIVDSNGRTIWLELNTQGQFLFVEGYSGSDLTNPFADFLVQRSHGHTS